MPIKHQDAIDACELVIQLSEAAEKEGANHLMIGPDALKTIHEIACAIKGSKPKQ